MSLNAISRDLERRNIPTRKGKTWWNVPRLREMLRLPTYMGVRYFNRITREEPRPDEPPKKWRKFVRRDPSEWITVKVPAIVSKRLFEKAEARLKKNREKYSRPRVPQLLKGLIRCGECGRAYCSIRVFNKSRLVSGKVKAYHWTSYRCGNRVLRAQHDPKNWKRCYNPRIACYILDETVLRIIQETMLDPATLLPCVERRDANASANFAGELSRVAEKIEKIEKSRRKLIDGYASGRTSHKKYVARNKIIDNELKELNREKSEILIKSNTKSGSLEQQIKEFCANARVQFDSATEKETKRTFLLNHVEKIVFIHGRVQIHGSIKVPHKDEIATFPFCIKGEVIDKRTRIYSRLPPQAFARKQRGIERRPASSQTSNTS